MEYSTIEDVLEKANSASGKKFKDFDLNNRLKSKGNKGGLGQIIEEGLFGYAINSNSEADFAELNLELKVTPIRQNKNGTLSAKERLVLNIINYMEEYKTSFYESSFWRKSNQLLLMFYLWEKDVPRGEYQILKSIINRFSAADLEIIRQDWEYIITQILNGNAHELSEGDTMYLGACPKGSNKNSTREQPFSDIPAMQRAFSLKQSYMTSLVRKEFNNEDIVSFANQKELRKYTLEQIIYQKFESFIGKTASEISSILNYQVNPSNKSAIANMTSRILGISGTKLDSIEEFSKANIEFKTIRVESNGLPKESMSFEQVDFNRWVSTNFMDSQFYDKFSSAKFLFVVFQHNENVENRDPKLYKVFLWNMPQKVIENELYQMWLRGKEALLKGVQLEQTKRGVTNNLPKQSESTVCYIRPKARDSKDKVQLPDGQMITKQAYWLNRHYIAEIIKSH